MSCNIKSTSFSYILEGTDVNIQQCVHFTVHTFTDIVFLQPESPQRHLSFADFSDIPHAHLRFVNLQQYGIKNRLEI